jgi:hypothetical protein
MIGWLGEASNTGQDEKSRKERRKKEKVEEKKETKETGGRRRKGHIHMRRVVRHRIYTSGMLSLAKVRDASR